MSFFDSLQSRFLCGTLWFCSTFGKPNELENELQYTFAFRNESQEPSLRSITLDDFPEALSPNVPEVVLLPGQQLVGLEAPINACLELINKHIDERDLDLRRVPPTCAARCARGGKTTFLKELGKALETSTSRNFVPLYVTFNGESKVKRREGEGADGWLYRTIAHALLPEDNPLKDGLAEEFGGLTCEKGVLQTYVKNEKDMVLLIDELNQLIVNSENEAEREAEERCAVFLKENFLSKKGNYFVFTSHVQETGEDLTIYMNTESPRQVELTTLPVVTTLAEMKEMDQSRLSGLTHMQAAFYSRVPALLFCAFSDRTLEKVVNRVMRRYALKNEDLNRLLPDFLEEIFTGKGRPEMQAFHQLTDARQENTIWIVGYIAEFLRRCRHPYSKLAYWLDGMKSAETNDGKAWEKIVAVAFALRYIRAQMAGPMHGWLHGCEFGTHLEFVEADQAARTVKDAIKALPEPGKYPALQLVLPTHSQLAVVDLMAVRREKGKEPKLVMATQQKEGKQSIGSTMPPEQTAKYYWLRGNSAKESKEINGWSMPSQTEIDDFLGPSFAAAAPATWRDD